MTSGNLFQSSVSNNFSREKYSKTIWLSHSGIEGLERCPRCFWLQYNRGIYQPEGIVSRLANRFDVIVKRYFDLYRTTGGLPPMIEGKVEGKLENPFQELYFYRFSEKYGLKGKLDECLVREDGSHTPVDHKTSSSDPTQREIYPAYQAQLDTYALLLENNKKPTSGFGHLIYFYPAEGKELHNGFPMQVTVQTLQTDPLHAHERIEKAIGVLEAPLPEASRSCPFCAWRDETTKIIQTVV